MVEKERKDRAFVRLTPEIRKRLKLLSVEWEMNYSDVLIKLLDFYQENQEE